MASFLSIRDVHGVGQDNMAILVLADDQTGKKAAAAEPGDQEEWSLYASWWSVEHAADFVFEIFRLGDGFTAGLGEIVSAASFALDHGCDLLDYYIRVKFRCQVLENRSHDNGFTLNIGIEDDNSLDTVFNGIGQVAELLAVGDFHFSDHGFGVFHRKRLADHVFDGLRQGRGLFFCLFFFFFEAVFQVFQEIEDKRRLRQLPRDQAIQYSAGFDGWQIGIPSA